MRASDILVAYGVSAPATSTSDVIARVAQDVLNRTVPERMYWATGLGKSALVAQKYIGTLLSLGQRAKFIHPVDGFHGDVAGMRPGDFILAISASGKTTEVLDMVREADRRGVMVVSLTTLQAGPIMSFAHRNLYSIDPSFDPGHIPSASFFSACAIADALAVELVGSDAIIDHPGGEIGKQLRT